MTDIRGLQLDLDAIQTEYLVSTKWYGMAVDALVEDIRALKPKSARISGHSTVVVTGVMRQRHYNVTIPVNAAQVCAGGSRAALTALVFKFVSTFQVAIALRRKVGHQRSPSARIVESILIKDVSNTANFEVAMLSVAFSKVIQQMFAANKAHPAVGGAKRLAAIKRARVHMVNAFRAGVSREDWISAYDDIAANGILQYQGAGASTPEHMREIAKKGQAARARMGQINMKKLDRAAARRKAAASGRRAALLFRDIQYLGDEIEDGD